MLWLASILGIVAVGSAIMIDFESDDEETEDNDVTAEADTSGSTIVSPEVFLSGGQADEDPTEDVSTTGSGDAETLKHVAMHVAASRPEYVNPEDVPADVVEKEKAVQVEIAMNEGKPAEIAEKMVVGRMKKFTGEISLTGQAFVMEPKKSVGEILKERGASVATFVRLEVGEGIDKGEEMSFADEVAAAQKG